MSGPFITEKFFRSPSAMPPKDSSSFWSKLRPKPRDKKDRHVASPDAGTGHGNPDSPPLRSGNETQDKKYGLFFLNQQQFEDLAKAGEARCSVDIVAVHGLNGHAYNTWTHQNGKL